MKYLLSKDKVFENWFNPILNGSTTNNIQAPNTFQLTPGIENPTVINPPCDDMIEKPAWLDNEGPRDIRKSDTLSIGRFYINGAPLSAWSAIGGSQVTAYRNQQATNWYYTDAIMKKVFPNGIKAHLNKDDVLEYNISDVVIQKMTPLCTGLGLNVYVRFKLNENELWGKFENVGVSMKPNFICENLDNLKIEEQIKLSGKIKNILFEWFKAKTGIYKCLAKEVLVLNEKGQYDKILEGSVIEVLHSDEERIKIRKNDTTYFLKKPNYYWFNWYFEKRIK